MEHSIFKHKRYGSIRLPQMNVAEPDELIYDLEMEKYHADRSSMSSTGVRKILKSPDHFMCWLAGQDVDDDDVEKDHFRFGRAAHMAILEPEKFRSLYVTEPIFEGPTKDGKMSTQSKAAKDAKLKWYDDLIPGALVLNERELEHLTGMIESLEAHPQASQLFRDGRPEVTGMWTHKETGVRCRIRPDYLTFDAEGNAYVIDLKTTRDLSEGLFAKDIARFRYHVQLAMYYDGIWAITGKEPNAAAFVAVEKNPPYSVAVFWADEDMLAKGRQFYQFALMTYKRCLDENDFPGLQGQGKMLSLPKWTDQETFPSYDWRTEQEI